MIIKTKYYVALFILLLCTGFSTQLFSINNTAFTIRVLLDEPLLETTSWTVESEDGIVAINIDNRTEKKYIKKQYS